MERLVSCRSNRYYIKVSESKGIMEPHVCFLREPYNIKVSESKGIMEQRL